MHADRRRADRNRTLAAARPTGVLRHRRTARRRQDHDTRNADHGRDRDLAGSGRLVDERGGAPQGAVELFPHGVPYILWDNIPRGSQISCPHIEKSCTAAYYSDRKLGVSEMVATAASTIHFFTGNNIGPRGDLASRSLSYPPRSRSARPGKPNIQASRPDRLDREHRAEILRALYTILLGNPVLGSPPDAEAKTRFKVWWRLIGSAVEHGAQLAGRDLDFQSLFLSQEEDDEDSGSLADVLAVMERRWREFKASDVADLINKRDADASLDVETLREMNRDSATLRDFLFGHAPAGFVATPKSVGHRLRAHVDEPVRSGERTLLLRTRKNRVGIINYFVHAST